MSKKYTDMLSKRDNKLRQMFLLTEPAFKKYKEQLDNDKYLSLLDKEMKKIMSDRKTPVYKKWLKYNDAFVRFADFKKMLAESKEHNDMENVRRISELEKELKKIQSNNVKKGDKDVQTSLNDSNESISLIPMDSSLDDSKASEKTEFKTDYYENELEMSSPEKDDSNEAHQLFDDKMISKKSPMQRIMNLPTYLSDKCLIDGKKNIQMNIAHMADLNDSQESYQPINVMSARILRAGDEHLIVGEDPVGNPVEIPHPLDADLQKIRNALITEHTRINSVIEKYKKQKGVQSPQYNIEKTDRGRTALRYKNKHDYVFPTEILDDVIKIMEKNPKLTPKKLEERINKLKVKLLQEKRQNEHNSTFHNIEYVPDTLLELSKLTNKRLQLVKKGVRHSSTPKRPSSLDKPKSKKLTDRFNQTTLDDFNMKKVKKIPEQKGEGKKRRWQKI